MQRLAISLHNCVLVSWCWRKKQSLIAKTLSISKWHNTWGFILLSAATIGEKLRKLTVGTARAVQLSMSKLVLLLTNSSPRCSCIALHAFRTSFCDLVRCTSAKPVRIIESTWRLSSLIYPLHFCILSHCALLGRSFLAMFSHKAWSPEWWEDMPGDATVVCDACWVFMMLNVVVFFEKRIMQIADWMLRLYVVCEPKLLRWIVLAANLPFYRQPLTTTIAVTSCRGYTDMRSLCHERAVCKGRCRDTDPMAV